MDRRKFLGLGGSALFAPSFAPLLDAAERSGHEIATNVYPWKTFANRAGERFVNHSEELLAAIASTGISGYEPIVESPAEFDGLGERLEKHGLVMRSIYVNSALHEGEKAGDGIDKVIAIARAAHEKDLGLEVIVTNPSPIRWGGKEDKSDKQLRTQAEAIGVLGEMLHRRGMTLAYHNHDAELRQGGREFHHMLTATDPETVKFCLDSHWIFRGCGDSEVAVFDVLENYWDRIVELHLRQSVGGVWSESFALEGDIDYWRLFEVFARRDKAPRLVLEQAVESKSPNTLDVVAAHRKGREAL